MAELRLYKKSYLWHLLPFEWLTLQTFYMECSLISTINNFSQMYSKQFRCLKCRVCFQGCHSEVSSLLFIWWELIGFVHWTFVCDLAHDTIFFTSLLISHFFLQYLQQWLTLPWTYVLSKSKHSTYEKPNLQKCPPLCVIWALCVSCYIDSIRL